MWIADVVVETLSHAMSPFHGCSWDSFARLLTNSLPAW